MVCSEGTNTTNTKIQNIKHAQNRQIRRSKQITNHSFSVGVAPIINIQISPYFAQRHCARMAMMDDDTVRHCKSQWIQISKIQILILYTLSITIERMNHFEIGSVIGFHAVHSPLDPMLCTLHQTQSALWEHLLVHRVRDKIHEITRGWESCCDSRTHKLVHQHAVRQPIHKRHRQNNSHNQSPWRSATTWDCIVYS